MTSSKFPLYMTDEEWQNIFIMLDDYQKTLKTLGLIGNFERATVFIQKLKEQFKKSGVKQ